MKYFRGYTLIELLVVAALVSLISGFFFFNFKEGSKSTNLSLQKRFFINVLRKTQTSSVHGLASSAFSGNGGYGVYIKDSQTFLVFADAESGANKNKTFDEGETVETFSLPQLMSFEKTAIAIHFSPIVGEITITPTQGKEDPFSFKIIQGNKEVLISINKLSGRID